MGRYTAKVCKPPITPCFGSTTRGMGLWCSCNVDVWIDCSMAALQEHCLDPVVHNRMANDVAAFATINPLAIASFQGTSAIVHSSSSHVPAIPLNTFESACDDARYVIMFKLVIRTLRRQAPRHSAVLQSTHHSAIPTCARALACPSRMIFQRLSVVLLRKLARNRETH